MKKTILFIFLPIFIFILMLSACGKKGSSESRQLIDSARKIKIVQIEGKATVTDERETLNCYVGMNLYSGDNVEVLNDSVLVIRFDEDKYVYLGENTKINILSVGKNSYKTNVYIEEGLVLAEIQNKLGEDEEFFLSSNNSVMAVRGTIFGLKVEDLGELYRETYSVYKGVTELFLADKSNDNIITGKLKDLSNVKIEVDVPKDHVLSKEDFLAIINNWLKDDFDEFDDEDDANNILDKVEIRKTTPSRIDYQQVIDLIGDGTVSYSQISYNAKGYFGKYDGNPHSIEVNVDTPNATVYYKENINDEYGINNFEYTNAGKYIVYYKIECYGYETKEDYKVIQIDKEDLNVENNKSYDELKTGYLEGLDADYLLSVIDIDQYFEISGLDIDNNLLEQATFSIDGKIKKGTNSYNVSINLPDNIKDNYNDCYITLEGISANPVTYISNGPISGGVLDITNINSFNKYNGISFNELISGISYQFDDETREELLLSENSPINYSYNKIIDNYIELNEGVNTFTAEITLRNGMKYDVPVSFNFNDDRNEFEFVLNPIQSVTKLGENIYKYSNDDTLDTTISYTYLDRLLGLNSSNLSVYVNIPTSISNDQTVNYEDYSVSTGYGQFVLNGIASFEFVLFGTNQYKSATITVSIYYGDNPTNIPDYSIGELKYPFDGNGVLMDFVNINDNSEVEYSLDGTNYSSDLVINEIGNHLVYYKISNGSNVIYGSNIISIEIRRIVCDNLDILKENMPILTDDNNVLDYNSNGTVHYVTSNDSSTISSLDEVYKIFTDIIKNSEYRDSIYNNVIEPTITIEDINNYPSFRYEIGLEGYESITGVVNFEYADFGNCSFGNQAVAESDEDIIVYNPIDLTINLNNFDSAHASRISTSHDIDNSNSSRFIEYNMYYSIDGGKTWTSDTPVFTEVGEYQIYMIYDFRDTNADNLDNPDVSITSYGLSQNDNYIIAIQNIKVIKE